MLKHIFPLSRTAFISALTVSTLSLGALSLTACASPASSKTLPKDTASSQQADPLLLNLKASQVLQLALIKEKDGEVAKAVRKKYFQTAIPHAESLGDKYLGYLKIKDTLIGQHKSRGIALYSFPNEAAQSAFQNSPEWPEYQKMRREGWDELHVFSATIPSDMKLTFDPNKDYTLAAAWTRPDTLGDYKRYLDGIEPNFDEIGAKYVTQFNDIRLQSHTDEGGNPSQLTIVEWMNGPDLKGLQQTQGYKENSKYFQKAVTRFDFYWLGVPQQKA